MKWKRNTGFDQIEDRRGQTSGAGSAASSAGAAAASRSRSRAARPAAASAARSSSSSSSCCSSGVLGGGSGAGRARRTRRRRGRAGRHPRPAGRHGPAARLHRRRRPELLGGRRSSASGKDYHETKLVLFDQARPQSGCGPASSATGPFYCPADQKVYLDLGFFDELTVALRRERRRLRDGLRRRPRVRPPRPGRARDRRSASRSRCSRTRQPANDLSVRQELQADCLAGVWAHSAAADLEPGDIDEALSAAAGGRRRPDPGGDDRAGSTPSLDPRLGRAAHQPGSRRVPQRQRQRLRHVRASTATARARFGARIGGHGGVAQW